MKKITITCDHCSNDLTYSSNLAEPYLKLSNENKIFQGNGFTTAMHYPHIINRDYHFCGDQCLKDWSVT